MFILVNLKAYSCDARAIARGARAVSESSAARVAVAPQTVQLSTVSETGVETWAQHISGNSHGSHTGSTLGASVAEAGATGTLLNHSECRLQLATIDDAITQAHDAGLSVIVCANNPKQIAAVTALGPEYVAVEPPELIGSGTPVSQADPDIVRDAVHAAASVSESVDVLCGAGISTGTDVAAARELGADGVLLASGVAKAPDPEQALNDLVSEL